MFADSMAHKMRKRARGRGRDSRKFETKKTMAAMKRGSDKMAAGFDNYYVCHFLLKNIDFKKA